MPGLEQHEEGIRGTREVKEATVGTETKGAKGFEAFRYAVIVELVRGVVGLVTIVHEFVVPGGREGVEVAEGHNEIRRKITRVGTEIGEPA